MGSLKQDIPSQIHLNYHDIRTRSISWVTFQKSPQYLFLKEGNVGRFKRSLVYRSNEKVFEASTEIFHEPEMNFIGKDFFSFSNTSPLIGPKLRYIHNVTFPVAIGGYSYTIGNQDAVSEKQEFE